MLLTVDIGNTTITLGVFKGSRLLKCWSTPTKTRGLLADLKKISCRYNLQDAIVCSVAPSVTPVIVGILQKLIGRRPYLVGKDIFVPIKNRYRKHAQVGQDRLVNAYAGLKRFGAPLIVVDFGTAVTFDLVSKNREYLGGMILPGLQISLDSLAKRTALLPRIALAAPRQFIGQDTATSILSGVVNGMASLVDDLGLRIKKVIGSKAKIVFTGGNSSFMARFSRKVDYLVPGLTLQGLRLIYFEITKK